MTEPLDSDLDEIFQAPADEFVTVRNALADRLRKAGDKASAAAVKALKRPTPAAWMLNQVGFRQPALLAQASAATLPTGPAPTTKIFLRCMARRLYGAAR